jgi:hypothetical protein
MVRRRLQHQQQQRHHKQLQSDTRDGRFDKELAAGSLVICIILTHTLEHFTV